MVLLQFPVKMADVKKRSISEASYCLFNSVSLALAPSGTVPVALAVGACILALLSLPLILVLVYKQRQNAQSGRRMYY